MQDHARDRPCADGAAAECARHSLPFTKEGNIMRRWMLVATLAGLAMTSPTLAGLARADDAEENKIDCSATDFAFADPAFEVKCADLSRSSINTENSVAGASVKKLFAIRKTQGITFLVAIDMASHGTRIYFKREGLSETISGNFTELNISGWVPENNFAGFETATFTGGFDNGDLNCLAFRREVNRRYEGIGREVYGISCTSNDVDQARQALKELKAAGE
jgi:hypothetical protein